MRHLSFLFSKDVIILFSCFLCSSSLWGDGYRNPPVTAEGIAKSDANKVFVDDASAVFYNPANLAFQDKGSLVTSVTFAHLASDFEGAKNDDKWQPLPNLFLSSPLGRSGIVFGFGISTPYGQGIEFDKNDLVDIGAFISGAPPSIHSAEISLINFNPSLAMKVGERLAVGVGADFYYSELTFEQYYPWDELGLPPFLYSGGSGDVEANGDGHGWGGNAALTWDVSEKQRLAFSYRSEVTVHYEGRFNINTVGPPVPPPFGNGVDPAFSATTSDFDLEITYPTILGLGYGVALSDDVRIEASLEWLEWSVNQSLKADLGANGALNVPQNWEDTITVAAGGDWQISDAFVFRAGYAFIETPIPDQTISPSLPDADRHVLSVGLGYSVGGHAFDLAYAYSFYQDRRVNNNQQGSFNGDYDIDSDLLGLTYSFTF